MSLPFFYHLFLNSLVLKILVYEIDPYTNADKIKIINYMFIYYYCLYHDIPVQIVHLNENA